MFRSQKPLINPSRELPPGAGTLGRLTGPSLCAVIATVDGRLQLLPCFGCRPQLSKEAIGGPDGARAQPGRMPPDWGAGPAQRTAQSQAEAGHTEAGSSQPTHQECHCGDPRPLGTSQMGQPGHRRRKRFIKPAVSSQQWWPSLGFPARLCRAEMLNPAAR